MKFLDYIRKGKIEYLEATIYKVVPNVKHDPKEFKEAFEKYEDLPKKKKKFVDKQMKKLTRNFEKR